MHLYECAGKPAFEQQEEMLAELGDQACDCGCSQNLLGWGQSQLLPLG